MTAVRQMQAEKVALVNKMKKMSIENKRLKQIVGELKLNNTANHSETSEIRRLNNSSRFMLS